MPTEVAQAFLGIVAGFGIRVVAASQGRELGAATRRRASSVPVNKPFFACQKGSGWKGIAVMKWRTPRQPVDREVLSSSQDQATPLIGRQFRRVTDPHGLI